MIAAAAGLLFFPPVLRGREKSLELSLYSDLRRPVPDDLPVLNDLRWSPYYRPMISERVEINGWSSTPADVPGLVEWIERDGPDVTVFRDPGPLRSSGGLGVDYRSLPPERRVHLHYAAELDLDDRVRVLAYAARRSAGLTLMEDSEFGMAYAAVLSAESVRGELLSLAGIVMTPDAERFRAAPEYTVTVR